MNKEESNQHKHEHVDHDVHESHNHLEHEHHEHHDHENHEHESHQHHDHHNHSEHEHHDHEGHDHGGGGHEHHHHGNFKELFLKSLPLGIIIMVLSPMMGVTLPFQRSEEHTSELQSRGHLVCRLLLEKKNVAIL